MMINTRVHTSNKNIKKQFDDLDSTNRKERFNYGIISDIDTSLPSSPLSIDIQRYVFYVNIDYSNVDIYSEPFLSNKDKDCLIVTTVTTDDTGYTYSKRVSYQATEYHTKGDEQYKWEHKNTPEETAQSISNFINNMFNSDMVSRVEGSLVTITTFSEKSQLNISNVTGTLFYSFNTKLVLRKGSVVFKDGNSLTLDDDADFDFVKPDGVSLDSTFRVCIRYKLIPTEYGEDLFGNQVVKRYNFESLDKCIVIEPNDAKEPNDDTVCIAIIKIIEGAVRLVDEGGHKYTYNRPWFTSKDDYHRSQLGTSDVTKHNPHGIGYNDIDSENTLHNRLLDNGIIVSPPNAIQGCPGILIDEILYADSAVIENRNFVINKYRKLTYTPNQILGVYEVYEDGENELAFEYIKNTSYIKINEEGLTDDGYVSKPKGDLRVIYLATVSGSSDIEYSQGIRINKIQNGDVVFSNGKSLKELSEYIDLYHNNINGYYVVGINNKGKIESNPAVKINKQLDVDSETIDPIDSRSRVKLYLYNTDAKYSLKCPDSGVTFESDAEYNISKTNAAYRTSANGVVSMVDESYTSPEYNAFVEVDSDALIIGGELDRKKQSDYIHIKPTGTTEGVTPHTETFVIDTIGEITNSRDKTVSIVDSIEGKLLKISWYMEFKFSSNANADDSMTLKWLTGCFELGSASYSSSGSVFAIQGSMDVSGENINDHTHDFNISLRANGATLTVTRLKIELVHDEIAFRYYITQKEGDNQVTRLLYDEHRDYSQFSDLVVKYDDGSIYFKKAGLIDKTKCIQDKSETVIDDVWEQVREETTTIYTPQKQVTESGTEYSVVEQTNQLVSSSTGEGTVTTNINLTSKTKLNAETITTPIYDFVPQSTEEHWKEEVEIPINGDCFPIVQTVKTNASFNVEVALYGESNGEAITEIITFDSSFREQEPYNYKLSSNAFDRLDKYTINNRSSSGNILILSYPISNYTNPCNINNTQFKDNNVITKFNDTRLCVAELDYSVVSREDITDMLSSAEVVLNME